jgi:hypothetical protein
MKCLLLYYAICCNKDGQFFRSYVDIYLDTGISERTVRSINKNFEDACFITRTEPTPMSGNATHYTMSRKHLEECAAQQEKNRDKNAAKIREKNAQRMADWRAKKAR